jgi:hypothetical protein
VQDRVGALGAREAEATREEGSTPLSLSLPAGKTKNPIDQPHLKSEEGKKGHEVVVREEGARRWEFR